jgi:cytochrome c oxidase cbb3-type subunit IV
MTYEEIKGMAAMAGLLIFIALSAGVLIYVFWPGNSKRFEHARGIPLEKDPDDFSARGENGR